MNISLPIVSRRAPLPLQVQVLAPIGCTLFCPWLCPTMRAQETAPVTIPLESASEARVSLRLQKMPLAQLLELLGKQSALQFRFAAVPDAEATLTLDEAPLRAALRDVLAAQGFALRTEESGDAAKSNPVLWLWRDVVNNDDVGTIRPASSWQMWGGAAAPHERWMKPPSPRIGEFSGTVSSGSTVGSGVPGVAPVGVRVRWRDSTRLGEEASWAATNITFQNRQLPGAQLDWRALSPETAKNVLRLRWPLWLREVPLRVQLAIETDRPATLWVNGARVLRGWTGVRRVELGSSLQVGLNLLALEWEALPPNTSLPTSPDAPPLVAPAAPPLLRYEWLVNS